MTEPLAIDGGTPTRVTPLPAWPHFDAETIEAVAEVLRSGRVNQWTGDQVDRFAEAFARFSGTRFAIPVANGTASLELILRALNIGPGDEVVVAPRSFMASASCVPFLGARPVFADVDRDTQGLSADSVEPVLTAKTRAIIAVHLAGYPVELAALKKLADARGIYLIEDCAQAHGARYYGEPVGSVGIAGSFSFCQDKIMSTGGEGGMVTTNDEALFRRIWELKDHGKSREAVFEREHPPGFRWLHESFGTNLRMTAMQARIGELQLERMAQWQEQRTRNAQALQDELAGHPALRFPQLDPENTHAWYKFYVFVRPDALKEGWDRDRILAALAAEGVPGLSGSCSEIYLEKAFQDADLAPTGALPVARELGETSLMFLVHPTMSEHDARDQGRALLKILAHAAK